jgi:hypothetical protein
MRHPPDLRVLGQRGTATKFWGIDKSAVKDGSRLPPELPGADAAAKRAQNPNPPPDGEGVRKLRWVVIAGVGWLAAGLLGAAILYVVLAFLAQYLITH